MKCSLTNTEVLIFVMGHQGGTVHQVADALGIPASGIINAGREEMENLCRAAQYWRKRQEIMERKT